MPQTTDETIIVSYEEVSSAKEYKKDDDDDDGGGSDDDESSDVTILLSAVIGLVAGNVNFARCDGGSAGASARSRTSRRDQRRS